MQALLNTEAIDENTADFILRVILKKQKSLSPYISLKLRNSELDY